MNIQKRFILYLNNIMSLICFIDTETSGLPITRKNRIFFPYQEHDAYDESRIVSIALVFFNPNLNKIISQSYFMRSPEDEPDMHWGAEHIHQITKEKASTEGITMNTIIQKNLKFLMNSSQLVAHNIDFDYHVFMNEIFRTKQYPELLTHLEQINKVCTMKIGKDITKIPSKIDPTRIIYPKLTYLLQHLTGHELVGAHNALNDCLACLEIYVELSKRNLIPL